MTVETYSISYKLFVNAFGEKLKPKSVVKKGTTEWVIMSSLSTLLKELNTISIPSYKHEQIKIISKKGKKFNELLSYCEKYKSSITAKKVSLESLVKKELYLMKALGYIHITKSGNAKIFFRNKLGEIMNNFIEKRKIKPSRLGRILVIGSLLFPTKLRLLYLLNKITPNPEEIFRIILSKLYNRELISFERNAIQLAEEIYYTNYFKTSEIAVDATMLWRLLPFVNQCIELDSFATINNYIRTDDPYTGFPHLLSKYEPSIETLKDKLLVSLAKYLNEKYQEINSYLKPLIYYI
jgi:hypothetical protein